MEVFIIQLCSTLCEPMNYSLPGSSVKRILLLLSREFSRQEYWNGLPFPSPGDLPNSGIKPGSSILQADSLPSETPWKPLSQWRSYEKQTTLSETQRVKMVDSLEGIWFCTFLFFLWGNFVFFPKRNEQILTNVKQENGTLWFAHY